MTIFTRTLFQMALCLEKPTGDVRVKPTHPEHEDWVDAVCASPARYYTSPRAVLQSVVLAPAEKLRALRSWELDERLLLTADDENMIGPDVSQFAEIRDSIRALTDRA